MSNLDGDTNKDNLVGGGEETNQRASIAIINMTVKGANVEGKQKEAADKVEPWTSTPAATKVDSSARELEKDEESHEWTEDASTDTPPWENNMKEPEKLSSVENQRKSKSLK